MSVWGAAALAIWAVAVVAANVGAMIPQSVFAGLHSTRLEGATINQLKSQVASLEAETNLMRQDAKALNQRFMLREQMSNDVTQRVGALETTIPRLLEAAPTATTIDPSATGSITPPARTIVPAQGGSVSVSTSPLIAPDPLVAYVQPMPQTLPLETAFGVAIGAPFERARANAVWTSLNIRAGTLLEGLTPVLGDMEGLGTKRLIAGPIPRQGEASALCGRFAQAGIACSVVDYVGAPLLNRTGSGGNSQDW